MDANQNNYINMSLERIATCETTLEKLSATCCLPVRSKKMEDTFDSLNNLGSQLRTANKESISNCIVEIEECGSQIGKLYVSCCTERKEPLYQQLFKQLNEIHTNVHRILGTAH
ncbi:hypothetical protein [Flagellimonas pacifica]|uniref:Uncharacterized protein n=1 Tax=Flagellimonas pacifica TaxID=1247520 RepID=A0A285MZW0_9FLAO|nr:hypothetical protein [Allomuricauda parva]SNZ01316.1 hypothetical protein SAMN06265377_3154 [Allomuricauda parva]